METFAKIVTFIIVFGAVSFGIDAVFAQLVLFLLGSFGIIAGFWQAFFMVALLWGIAGGASKAAS